MNSLKRDKKIHTPLQTPGRLYFLDVINRDSVETESLSSYILRLAQAHTVSVSTLFNLTIDPENQFSKNRKNVFYHCRLINTTQHYAQTISTVLEKLTFQKDLSKTTLLSWDSLFDKRGLVKRNLAWCPDCLNENQKQPYFMLNWALSTTSVCLDHTKRLVNHCPGCQKEIPYITHRMKIGHCPYCGTWLGAKNPQSEVSEISPEQLWITQESRELLNLLNFKPTHISLEIFGKAIFETVNKATQHTNGVKLLLSNAKKWMRETHKINFEKFLRNLRRFQIPIKNIFENVRQFVEDTPSQKPSPVEIITRHTAIEVDIDAIQRYIKILYQQEKQISVRAIERKFNLHHKFLNNHHPELIQMIALHNQKLEEKEKSRITAKLQVIIETNRGSEKKISLTEVSRKLNVNIEKILRYCPDRCQEIIEDYDFFCQQQRENKINLLRTAIETLMNLGLEPKKSRIRKITGEEYFFFGDDLDDIRVQIINEVNEENSSGEMNFETTALS
jgi:hypothetical protein